MSEHLDTIPWWYQNEPFLSNPQKVKQDDKKKDNSDKKNHKTTNNK